jgi:lysophospholipase L1-like esterase
MPAAFSRKMAKNSIDLLNQQITDIAICQEAQNIGNPWFGDSQVMRQQTRNLADHIDNRGVSGATTRHVRNMVRRLRSPKEASFAILSIGINDIKRALKREQTEEQFRCWFAQILDQFTIPLVVTAIHHTRDPNISAVVNHVNLVEEEICGQHPNCIWVPSNLDGPDELIDPDYTVDGIHLNAAGYLKWYEALRAFIPPSTKVA